MHDDNGNQLTHAKWDSRLMKIYWMCNAIILAIELVLMFLHYRGPSPEFEFGYYARTFIIIPSGLIFFFTALCELAIRLSVVVRRNLQPYIIALTCVAFCAVLLMVHYNVKGIYVVYVMPVFFSLVYNSKRILLFTFLSSLFVFIVIYRVYFSHVEFSVAFNRADIMTNIALLIASYYVGKIILSRFEEIINILAETKHSAYETEIAKRKAEAVAEARTRFLANMSHEIRTPMNGIIGLSELALDDRDMPERQKDYLLKIRNSADGLLAIINNILDITKIDSGEVSLERIPFGLHTVLNECEIIITHKAIEKGLNLYFYNDSGLENKLIGDPTKLRQALLNFLSNAVKFTKEGSVTLVAKPDERPTKSGRISICFEISDTGIGMTNEQCEKIFEPFNQADNSISRSFGGTGLGLSISKSLIELMGGEISVKSIPSIGSRFSFSVEFELSGERCEAGGGDDMNMPRPLFDGDILLCEDDAINQQVAVQNLEKLGLRVVLATNGKAGVDAVYKRARENKPFDLIFMDINMPVMDGLSAAKELLENNIRTPVIAMTAVAMTDDRERYMDAGMAGYLCKPFKTRELWACLLKHLTPVKIIESSEPEALADSPPAPRRGGLVIDEDVGIGNFAGNKQAYLQALEMFSKKYPDTPDIIERAVEAGDFVLAERTAHTVKGAAAIIGALGVSKLSAGLEAALKKDGAYYNGDIMEPYKQEYSKVLQCLGEMNI